MSHAIQPKTGSAEAAITTLAKETATSTDLVRSLYEEEVASLKEQVTIHQFVGVIATRLVRQKLRELNVTH